VIVLGVRMQIRRMSKSDLPAVGILAGKLLRMHHDFDPQRFMLFEDPERGYSWWLSTQLEQAEVILLVAEDTAGSVVAYAYARMEPKSYNDLLEAHTKLHDIFVDESARRGGVGEALLREVLRVAGERGTPRVVLMTAAQNEAAQHLFERLGFRVTMLEMTRES
jgi:ribosomal protein S18 acetylase RimI-like enzyme